LWNSITNFLYLQALEKSRMLWSKFFSLPLLAAVLICCTTGQLDNRTELHIAFITSFGGEYDSSIAVPAVRLAASRINENSAILSDYKLVVELVEDRSTAENSANSMV
jgi:hypothetical protein